MSMPSVNTAIHSAQQMLELIQREAPLAQMIQDGDPRSRLMGNFDKQNILRSQLVAAAWRKIGRQVCAMHPEVVEEVRVSSSDKVPAEILRVLPYINPMVVYSDPPSFNPQHRRAHFKMQPYGPGKTLRKLIFVSAYWTHLERLGVEGVNTARRVPRVNGKGSARESVDTVLGMSALPVEVQ